MYRAKTGKCLTAIRNLPNLTARLGNFRFSFFRLYPSDNADADFVEQIERDGDENQGHQVSWCYDGCYQHNYYKGMLTILGQHVGCHDAHFSKEEGNDGQLEHHTHDERQRDKRGDIRIKRDIAHHLRRHAISAEETERDREQHEVGHQHAKQKQHINDSRHLHRVLTLVLIQGGRYEAE